MIHHIILHGIAHKDIHLVFGCRRFGDALYGREMEELAAEVDGFFYHPVFSRESADLPGIRTGYVHAVYESICRGPSGSGVEEWETMPANFFLCGWKDMIDEARKRIPLLGYDRKDIHFEIYG